MSKYKFSLITLAILVLSSFVPVLQVLLLLLNSFLVKPIGWLFIGVNDGMLIYGFNGVMSLLMFLLFYHSSRFITKLFSLLGILIFFVPFLFYATEKAISTEKFYFLQFLIIGVITGVILAAIEAFKRRAAH